MGAKLKEALFFTNSKNHICMIKKPEKMFRCSQCIFFKCAKWQCGIFLYYGLQKVIKSNKVWSFEKVELFHYTIFIILILCVP
jgi:hypothetical protein